MRLVEIDFLRGIAVIMVLFRHHWFADVLKQAGWAGVDLFFVLSGFLVSGLLFSEYKKFGNIKPGLFLIRRGFKIYPLFYLMLAGSVVRVLWVKFFGAGLWSADPKLLLGELLFLQNYLGYLWPHTWSLAVEEHFYFSLTAVVFIMTRKKVLMNKKLFGGFVLLTIATCLGLRLYNASIIEYSHPSHLFPTHLRYDSLLWGVFLSYHFHFNRKAFQSFFSKHSKAILVVSLAFISTLFFFEEKDFFMHTIGLSLLYWGFGSILILMVLWDGTNRFMEKYLSKPIYHGIAKIGFYSYSIYLWHIMVLQYILPYIREKVGIAIPLRVEFIYFVFISVVIGILISKIVEMPALAIRDKYFPRRAAAIRKEDMA